MGQLILRYPVKSLIEIMKYRHVYPHIRQVTHSSSTLGYSSITLGYSSSTLVHSVTTFSKQT